MICGWWKDHQFTFFLPNYLVVHSSFKSFNISNEPRAKSKLNCSGTEKEENKNWEKREWRLLYLWYVRRDGDHDWLATSKYIRGFTKPKFDYKSTPALDWTWYAILKKDKNKMKQKFLIRLDTQFTQAHSVGYFEFPIILVVKNHTTMEKDRIMEKHNVHACKCNFMRHENLYATKEHP